VTICEEIAEWAVGLRTDDLPSSVRERAELQALCVAAGRAAGESAAAPFAAVAPDGPVGEIYRSAVASIAHDWDDYLFMGHTGHSAVPAAAAFEDDAERRLVAQVAANEVTGRLGAALFLGPHNGQFWASIHCASAAIAVSVGLGLDAERTAHALAVALYQPPYGMWPGFMGPRSKLLTAAEPAAAGARAALLAAEGVTGALDVIEHPRGVLTALSFAPRPAMFGALGRAWLTDTLAYKRLPGCAYLQSVAEAALASGVEAEDVASVEIEAGWLTCEMEELGRGPDLTPIRVNFSATLTVAIALLAGRLTPAELEPSWLAEHEPKIRALAARGSLRHRPAMTARTLRGTLEAGASPGFGFGDLLRIHRRLGDANMRDANPAPAVLGAIRADRDLRRHLGRSLRERLLGAGGDAGIDGLDTAALRMTFPGRLRIRLRDGSTRVVEGTEPGSCGRPLAEQRAVVEERLVSPAASRRPPLRWADLARSPARLASSLRKGLRGLCAVGVELAARDLAVPELEQVGEGSLEAGAVVGGSLGSPDDHPLACVDELLRFDAERGPVVGDMSEVADDLIAAVGLSTER
jgi:MmgE/PrpD N-terminal domain